MFNILSHKGNAKQKTLRFHLTPIRMALIKKTTTNAGKDVEDGSRTLYTIGGNVNQYGHSLINKK
jgi:hypothetical protein